MTSLDEAARVPAYPVHSVGRALELLLLLREQDSIGISEASRRLGIARSTAHRLVTTLEQYGFARRGDDARYSAGPALVSLGLAAVQQLDVRRCARPHMERLAAEVEETVTLIGFEGTSVRFLDCVEGPLTIRVASRTGLVRPSHCTSAGKAMLALFPEDQIAALYPNEELPTLTGASLATRTDLLRALEQIRRDGYATNQGESDRGLRAVGVAIPGVLGQVPAAGLGISAPADRLQDTERVAAAANRAAQAISDALRGRPNGP